MIRPRVKLTEQDGNIFNLVGVAAKALRKAGQHDRAGEMTSKVFGAGSYEEALAIICEYVEAE